jgi:hypothetical protein
MFDYETEITRTIWNNKHGTKIIVKPDADGGLIEIEGDGKIIIFTVEAARLVAAALLATADEVEAV